MGYYKWRLVLSLLLSLAGISVGAQQERYKLRIGAGVGNAYSPENILGSEGAVSDKSLELSSDFLVYQAYAEAFFSDAWSIGSMLHTRPGITEIQDVQLYAAYYLDNGYILSDKSFISLFLKAGAAYDLQQEAYFLPLGGGLKFRLASRLNLNVEMQYRYFPDEIQEDVNFFNPEVQYYTGVMLSYSFARDNEGFRAPEPYLGQEQQKVIPVRQPQSSYKKKELRQMTQETEDLREELVEDTSIVTFAADPELPGIDTSSFMGKKLRSPELLKADSLMKRLQPAVNVADSSAKPQIKIERTDSAPPSERDSLAEYRDSLLNYLRFEAERLELQKRIEQLDRVDSATPIKTLVPRAEQQEQASSETDHRIQLLQEQNEYLRNMTRELQNSLSQRQPVTVESPASTETTEVQVIREKNGRDILKLDPAQAILLAQQGSRLKRVENQLDKILERLNAGPVPGGGDTSYVYSSTRDTIVTAGDTNIASATRGLNQEMLKMQQELQKLRSQLDSTERARMASQDKPGPGIEPLTTQMVFFATNSTSLTAQARQDLQEIIGHAERTPNATYRIVGFTDKSGSAEYNRMLSEKRAQAVKDFLTQNAIDAKRLELQSAGIDKSLKEKRAQYGRRVEVRLIR